jgi:monofunctional biosynthetic peptidoglycan transglycosylase
VAAVLFWVTLPDVRPLARAWPATTSFMERRKAELVRQGVKVKLEWSPVPLSRISPTMQRAAIVAEDARFWNHDGVDWEAMRGAFERNWEEGRLKVGGSTITQQLAKNLYLSPARTPWRKLRELAIAFRLEHALSKKRILELYLNVIEFGPRTFGVEAAARRYMGVPASDLTREQAATLAAVIPSPRIYDPVRHADRVRRRSARILQWM